jgi:chemotaxis protein CheY-P-specific phosphatase CheC/ActR/RegA family two-component response regulator
MEIDPIITAVLEEVGSKVAAGLGGMLGCELELPAPTTVLLSKKEFFAQTRKKQVMTRMVVSGDHAGDMFVFCRLKDAVQLSGTLIMLPPVELEERVKKEVFGEEEVDSFGEIANIISGELCSAFEELYPEKLHFKKADLEALVPSKVKMDAPEPFPPGLYLKAAYPVTLDGKALDELIFLFPAAMLGITVPEAQDLETPPDDETSVPAAETAAGRLVNPEEAAALLGELSPDSSSSAAGIVVETTSKAKPVQAGQPISMDEEPAVEGAEPVILVIAIDGSHGQTISAMINEHGYNATLVDRKENFKDLSKTLSGRVKGLVLAMEEIDEQSFSVVIKVRTAFGGSVPLMAAGSQWTRSKVLQAVKYGVCDILVTPASAEEVLEKVEAHFKSAQNVAV